MPEELIIKKEQEVKPCLVRLNSDASQIQKEVDEVYFILTTLRLSKFMSKSTSGAVAPGVRSNKSKNGLVLKSAYFTTPTNWFKGITADCKVMEMKSPALPSSSLYGSNH